MSAMAWWGIPLGATAVAIGWTRWVSRPRRPAEPDESVKAYERFRAAFGSGEAQPRR